MRRDPVTRPVNPDAKEVASLVFETNYRNKAEVITLAKRLGRGLIVVKHADRPNYNIVHNSRRDRWDKPSIKVVHRT